MTTTVTRTRRRARWAAPLLAVGLIAAACGGDDAGNGNGDDENGSSTPTVGGETQDLSGTLLGAGATFPTPLFLEWLGAYQEIEPEVDINYQSVGSGGGIEQFLSETVDFGSTERYLTDEEVEEAEEIRGCASIHIPVVFGSVTVAYNLPQIEGEELVLDAETTAAIFARDITNWNDPAIAALNPDLDLPDVDMIPVHRSDGSGTTYIFTRYLSDEVESWDDEYGFGSEINWAAGTVGGAGNEGVTAGVQQNPGGIGYVSFAYAVENDIPVASQINADGNAVAPTVETVAAAPAAIVDELPEDLRFDILNVGADAFPIVGTNWVLAWECGYDENTEELLKAFWTWAVTEGAPIAEDLVYAPLTGPVIDLALEQIDKINSQN
ncbi:MAG: phosphate ABC transporter substrate-binding protein PstS [Acidimicrobiia bacterium]|nr:phosphate ABC transporter substrate-binding protein PstS [Acidimicrobiia bacterium]